MPSPSSTFTVRAVGASLATQTLALVLCGGRGSRLAGLTDRRAKPAVPFGGAYRIVDFVMSNCIHSGVQRIGVLTQYKAQSLVRHIERAWGCLDRRVGEFVEILPAQARTQTSWYAGTADAVYQNLDFIRRERPRFVLVLAGDHIYKMDFRAMLVDHVARGAELTVGCLEVPAAQAKGTFGVMQVGADFRVIGFEEKPERPRLLPGSTDSALASMGIYVFNTDFLCEQLMQDAQSSRSGRDFGHDVIPCCVRERRAVYAHPFSDSCVGAPGGVAYWRDVGTVDAYWQAHMDLTSASPHIALHDADWPILTVREPLAPTHLLPAAQDQAGRVVQSLVAGGCVVGASHIRRSVLCSSVRVGDGCRIDEAVILPEVVLGAGCTLRRVIIDKHCNVPPGLVAGLDSESDRNRFYVTAQGITLITPQMLGQSVDEATEQEAQRRVDADPRSRPEQNVVAAFRLQQRARGTDEPADAAAGCAKNSVERLVDNPFHALNEQTDQYQRGLR